MGLKVINVCGIRVVIEYNIKILLLFNGLVQEGRNSSALAIELRLSWTNPSIWYPLLLVSEMRRYYLQMYHAVCDWLKGIDFRWRYDLL